MKCAFSCNIAAIAVAFNVQLPLEFVSNFALHLAHLLVYCVLVLSLVLEMRSNIDVYY